MSDPVDRQVVDDSAEPGREAARSIGLRRVASQPPKVVFAERLADTREDIHDVIGIAGIAPDRREDEPAIPPDEDVPRGLGRAGREWTEPGFHTDPHFDGSPA